MFVGHEKETRGAYNAVPPDSAPPGLKVQGSDPALGEVATGAKLSQRPWALSLSLTLLLNAFKENQDRREPSNLDAGFSNMT
jgi:hypothetical protein